MWDMIFNHTLFTVYIYIYIIDYSLADDCINCTYKDIRFICVCLKSTSTYIRQDVLISNYEGI